MSKDGHSDSVHGPTNEVERLFQGAAELPASERSRFLDEHCPRETPLRQEVEELLEHLENAPVHLLEPRPLSLDGRALTPSLPDRIGDYEVLGRLGAGGMGEVYHARDPRLEREIAIKVLPRALADDSEWQLQIQTEARLLASVSHPNIATVYSLGEADGEYFLTMELVDGETLAARLSRTSLSLREFLSLAQQVASALESAHRKGVVHRDLKPGNIMLTGVGVAKVLDFGIARSTRSDGQSGGEERVVGTPGYMSPEQIRGEPADPRTDIWAYGCLLYECLSGRRAFPGDTASDALDVTLRGEIDWEVIPPSTPTRVRELLARCLATDSQERLPVMAQARRQIDEELAIRARRLPATAPALDAPNNLPASLTTFVGRGDEMSQVQELLARSPAVTLTGPGGCGKSRLALEIAHGGIHQWADGAWFVELAPLSEAESVPSAIAGALGLKEHAGEALADTIITFLRDRQLLLILDNCEHLLTEVAFLVSRILGFCPEVRVVATSRERLATPGEVAYQVPSLKLPADQQEATVAEMNESEAVQLFLDRARSASSDFELSEANAAAVARICQRLDGIPLALELAAARVNALATEEIADRLTDRLGLLSAGSRTVVPRHQTLRATIDWSYQLLDESERILFRRLSVFAGGWSLGAAEAVCAGREIESWEILDLHARLVEKSLVDVVTTASEDRARYRMLETVRQYARGCLEEADEAGAFRTEHCRYFTQLAEEAEAKLRGPAQGTWLATLELEHDNMKRALSFCSIEASDSCLRLVGALGRFWAVRGHWKEGRGFLDRAVEVNASLEPSPIRVKATNWAGTLARIDGDVTRAETLYEQSLDMAERIRDRAAVATALSNLGHLAYMRGDQVGAGSRYEKGLAVRRELGDPRDIATSLTALGMTATALGEYERARECYEECLAISRETGDLASASSALLSLSSAATRSGDHTRAQELLDEALDMGHEMGDRRFIALVLQSQAGIALDQERYEEAGEAYSKSMALREELGDRRAVGHSLCSLGYVSYFQGDLTRARAQLEESLDIGRQHDDLPSVGYALCALGYVAQDENRLDEAEACLLESLHIRRRLQDRVGLAVSLEGLGMVASARGDHGQAIKLFSVAETIREAIPLPLTPRARQQLDGCLAAARDVIGQDALDRGWADSKLEAVDSLVASLLGAHD